MKLTSSIVAIAALSTISFAGGDIIEPVFEQETFVVPVEPVIVPEPAVIPEPVVIPTPKPVVVAPVIAEALGLYIAGGVTSIAINNTDRANFFSDEVNQEQQVGLTGRIGYDFMDYLGAELRGTYGLDEDTATSTFKQVGAYLKPNYNVTDDVNLYGLLGASQSNLNRTGEETGFSYGAGLDYGIADNISVFTDVVNYMKKSNTNSQWGLTLGAAYQF